MRCTSEVNRMRPFDLNMEEVLEDWEAYHAVRDY